MVAMDCTIANGHPRNENSLHYLPDIIREATAKAAASAGADARAKSGASATDKTVISETNTHNFNERRAKM